MITITHDNIWVFILCCLCVLLIECIIDYLFTLISNNWKSPIFKDKKK